MTEFIPGPLRELLGEARAKLLADVVMIIERTLHHVYDVDGRAYDPSWGDNSQLFGLGIWHHGWFAIEEALEAVDGIVVTHEDNSHRVHVAGLTLAVYKGGDDEVDSIFGINLNGSATKRSYVDRNQLQLFSPDDLVRPVADRAYELRTLWLVHFGNPREGLVKLHLGAPTRDAEDNDDWAWHVRVDTPGGDGGGDRQPLPETPPSFDERPEPEIDLELEEDVGEGSGPDGE